MSEYTAYSQEEIETFIKEPWEVSDQPYKLHAAYALSCLTDFLLDDAEEDGEMQPRSIWGMRISPDDLARIVKDAAIDFNDAAENRKQIKINGRAFSVRKVNAYDHDRITKIFRFPVESGSFIVSEEGVMNLAGLVPGNLRKYETSATEACQNRTYLRKVVMLAEDDEHDGWDKLTDMEVAMYCWAMYYNRNQSDNLKEFLRKYKKHIYVTEAEIRSCFTEKARLHEKPYGMYTFSASKVEALNRAKNQKSIIAGIDDMDADDYWYEVALTTTFKPLK